LLVDSIETIIDSIKTMVDSIETIIDMLGEVVQPLVGPALSHLVHGRRS
jgi:hypothetical protein